MEIFSTWEVKHPLMHSWTLWYLDNDKTKQWEECLMEVGSFGTIEDFWCLMNHIKPVSMLKSGCDYSLFKKGIRPMWEDTANSSGGRWLVNLDKKIKPITLDELWLNIAMCLIGERLEDVNEKICGATINVRPKGNRIGLWIRDDDNNNSEIIRIGMKLKELLCFTPQQIITFQLHRDVQEKNGTSPKFMYYI